MSRRLLSCVVLLTLTGCEELAKLAEELLDYDGIAQAVPPSGSNNVPLRSPVIIFADGVYNNVRFEARVTDSAGEVSSLTDELRVEERTSGADKDIYVVTTADGWPASSEVQIVVQGGIDRQVRFSTVADAGFVSAPTDLDFETGSGSDLPTGWRGFGDYGAIAAKGSLEPSSGNRYLAMSSGDAVRRSAVAGTSTLVVSDPIDTMGAQELSFDYTFQSSEFNDYCDSDFDDTMMLVVSGTEDALARVVDSVNLVCDDGRQKNARFPGMPDEGDSVYKGTRVTAEAVDISGVGDQLSVSFVVTDVGDDILTSVVAVDDIALE